MAQFAKKKAPSDPPKPNSQPAANGHSQPGEKRKRPGDPASQSASKARRTGASSSRKIPHTKDGSASRQNRPIFTQKNGDPARHGGSAPAPNRPTFTQKNGAPTQRGGPTIPKKDPLPALPRPTFIEKPKEEAQNSLESGNDYAVFPKHPRKAKQAIPFHLKIKGTPNLDSAVPLEVKALVGLRSLTTDDKVTLQEELEHDLKLVLEASSRLNLVPVTVVVLKQETVKVNEKGETEAVKEDESERLLTKAQQKQGMKQEKDEEEWVDGKDLGNKLDVKIYRDNEVEKQMWKVPQMETALMDHQVLGVDWMLSREKVADNERDFRGGFVCDAMGMGKTMQSIATMLLNPPPEGGPRITLVVAPVALLHQWAEEIDKNITGAHQLKVHIYHGPGKAKIETVNDLEEVDVLLCSYSAVMASWPKEATEKAKKKMSVEELDNYEKEHVKNRKLLHRTKFWRIILDECHYIKNHAGRTSKGCQNLNAVNKWALSGTPIQNQLWDVFGTLIFLGHPTLSDKEEFQSIAGLEGNNPNDARKLRLMLRNCMMRRNKTDYFMGKRLITLPAKTTRFIRIGMFSLEIYGYSIYTNYQIELSHEEQRLYDLVCEYFKELINKALADESPEGKRKAAILILISLTRMRQLVDHPYLIFEVLSKLRPGQIKEAIEKPGPAKLDTQDDDKFEEELFGPEPDPEPTYQGEMGDKETSAIRRIIKAYGDMPPEETTEAVILCPQCGDTAEDPVIIKSCGHIFCRSCLEDALDVENYCPMVDDDGITCKKSAKFSIFQPPPTHRINWLENPVFVGPFAHSSKTLAFVKQLAEWRISHPDDKVIVFSNFTQMLDILAKILDQAEMKYARYDGSMSMTERAEALETFRNDVDMKVFLISIKAGGVGLNLTTANLVICFDMWWNAAAEHQAFDRVHRLGQQKDVFVSRLIVKGSVEDKMLQIQQRKLDLSSTATGDNGYGVGKLTIMDLMSCFGTLVKIGGKEQLV